MKKLIIILLIILINPKVESQCHFYAPTCTQTNLWIANCIDRSSPIILYDLDRLIKNGLNHNWWGLMSRFNLFALDDAKNSLVDLKHPTISCALSVVPPTFVADSGFYGNGVTSYVNTNFNPARDTAIGYFQKYSHSLGVATLTNGTSTNSLSGIYNSTNNWFMWAQLVSSTQSRLYDEAGYLSLSNTNTKSILVGGRSGTGIYVWLNNGSHAYGSVNGAAAMNYNFYLGGLNGTTFTNANTLRWSVFFVGSAITTDAVENYIANDINTYFKFLGKTIY